MMKILIADDEPDLLEVLAATFRMHWRDAEIVLAQNGEMALDTFYSELPDLVLLDVSMPKLTGIEVCQRIRQVSDVPIIMITVKDEEMDKVRGLEAGADDYITKPFGYLELLARVRAVRRRHLGEAPSGQGQPLQIGDLTFDFERREVLRLGEAVQLTPTEYSLIYQLARNAGHVLAHGTLLRRVWGEEYVDEVDYLKVYVRRLRKKLEELPQTPRYILTERGVGYRLAVPSR
jgi:two-component system KDP operon response regulator KdpE